MNIKIVGTVPQPMSDTRHPPFTHHPDFDPRASWQSDRSVGERGRKVSVVTHSESVAADLMKVFEAVFCKVQVRRGR